MSPEAWQYMSVVITVVLLIALTVAAWYFRSEYVDERTQKRYLRARAFVWELVLAAEKRYQGEGKGKTRLEWVKSMVADSPVGQFVSEELLEVWVDSMLTIYESEKENTANG